MIPFGSCGDPVNVALQQYVKSGCKFINGWRWFQNHSKSSPSRKHRTTVSVRYGLHVYLYRRYISYDIIKYVNWTLNTPWYSIKRLQNTHDTLTGSFTCLISGQGWTNHHHTMLKYSNPLAWRYTKWQQKTNDLAIISFISERIGSTQLAVWKPADLKRSFNINADIEDWEDLEIL